MEYTRQSPHQVIELGTSTIIVINGDCAEVLKELHESEIKFNSAITSPPYAEQRKDVYDSISPEDFPEWYKGISTEEQDWILDPFGGSGTTALSAVQLNSNCVLIEKSEQYYNLIIERLLQYGRENYL